MFVAGSYARSSFLAAALLWIAVAAEVPGIEIQGHRGARGLMPENTLPAFATALSVGVDAIELDVVVTADGVVVVSHDPELSPHLTRGPDGRWLDGTGPAIAALSLSELKRYDVGRMQPGSEYAAKFPHQAAVDGTTIPTLDEVLKLVAAAGNQRVRFNIETKMRPGGESTTLDPDAFADRVLDTVRAAGVAERSIIQSFYWPTVTHVREVAPEIITACLTSEQSWFDNIHRGRGTSPWTGLDVAEFSGSVPRMVKASGCGVWSPYFRDLDQALLNEAHALGLEVIVWTVNAPEDMERLIDLGVDGIITDYPDRLRGVMQTRGLPVPQATPVTMDRHGVPG